MNLNRVIKTLKGEEAAMSIPSQAVIDALPKNKDGNPDMMKLPRETVRNVLLNCLANYAVKDRKEIFFINTIAQSIMDDESVELKDKLKKFLIEVVYAMTLQEDGEKQTGLYFSWVTAQVLTELGVAPDQE